MRPQRASFSRGLIRRVRRATGPCQLASRSLSIPASDVGANSTPVAAAATASLTANHGEPWRSFYQLSKPVLSTLVVGSGVAGFMMAGPVTNVTALAAVTAGTYLTAFSANTFNQCYEVRF